MTEIILNNEWKLIFPDGFRVMDAEEKNRLNFIEKGPGECLTDPEKHITVSIAWKAAGFLASALLNTRALAQNMEAQTRKPMSAYGNQLEGFVSGNTGGKEFDGYRCRYEVQGTGMFAQSLVVRSKRTFYYLHFYCREAMREESLEILEEILGTAVWI